MRLAVFVLTTVFVTIGELLLTSAVLQEVFEIAVVLGAPNMSKQPFAILLIVLPLSLVIVPFGRPPNSMPILLPFLPLPFKHLPIRPSEFALAFSFVVLKRTNINTFFGFLGSFHFLVISELSLEPLPLRQ